jgi:hypothetical protein
MIIRRYLCCLLFGIAFFSSSSYAATPQEQALTWVFSQQNDDGSWGRGNKKFITTYNVLSMLKQKGIDYGDAYNRGLAFALNKDVTSLEYRAKKILLSGVKNDAAIKSLINEMHLTEKFGNRLIGKPGWGSYSDDESNYFDTALVLEVIAKYKLTHSLNLNISEQNKIDILIEYIKARETNGAWKNRKHGDPISYADDFNITLELSRSLILTKVSQLSNLVINMNTAVQWMANSVSANGNVISGITIEERLANTARLASWYIDLEDDFQSAGIRSYFTAGVKSRINNYLSQTVRNGSIRGDLLMTTYMLSSSSFSIVDSDKDGLPNYVETALGRNPNLAESVATNSIDTLNYSDVMLRNYNYSFLLSGLAGYELKLVSALPKGLSLSGNKIAGKPTVEGVSVVHIKASKGNKLIGIVTVVLEVIDKSNNTVDRDKDGIKDSWELVNGWSPLSQSDGQMAILEATQKDSDGDGLNDYFELENGLNYLSDREAKIDTDDDGINDAAEYIAGWDPYKSDTDGDGLPDKWEQQYGLNPSDANDAGYDFDVDGLNNKQEYIAKTHPRNPDTDGDKVTDGAEKAKNLNPKIKKDTDNDGMSDDWETYYGLNKDSSSDKSQDKDSDGLANYLEYAVNSNPLDVDTDKDNMYDGDEYNIGRMPTINEPAILIPILSVLN